MHKQTKEITDLMLDIAKKAREEVTTESAAAFTQSVKWPVTCTVG